MKAIREPVWSHLSLSDKFGKSEIKKSEIDEVRASSAMGVNTFSELVKHIAYISYHNPDYPLFFRAQSKDHLTTDRMSSLYPSIYRGPFRERSRISILRERFAILRRAEEELLREFAGKRLLGRSKLEKFREMRWAILQHYCVCKTPLLDITHSLRVACSFAMNYRTDDSYIFVLGVPHPHGGISYSVEEELMNIRLLSICPPKAIRPYFQEGFLVGSFPTSEEARDMKLDVARRLIAKFHLKRATFMDTYFQPIPIGTLFPKDDVVKRICERIKDRVTAHDS
jgi:hypothetical protein